MAREQYTWMPGVKKLLMANDITLVFVHGWSVTDSNTYGQLPIRLRNESAANGLNINVRDIFLSEYISFHDEVRLQDISRAFQAAVVATLGDIIKAGNRFIAITHSTGGPVMRDWTERYRSLWTQIPMSHLIMLAPANFGSALAQLGKEKIGRLKSWLEQVQPGQGVLDWLELGSSDSWKLNADWVRSGSNAFGPDTFFPFALIGQAIDRKFYDHLNSYTGELGSDGVVRSAAANLNATHILVKQPVNNTDKPDVTFSIAGRTAFRIVRHSSHSGTEMGILSSEQAAVGDAVGKDTVDAIMRCVTVATKADYDQLCAAFDSETAVVQSDEKIEMVGAGLLSLADRYYVHDRFTMVIFRVCDSEGYPVTDYDLVFTAGAQSSANLLPEGFFVDRQQNSKNPETVTYFIDYDIMVGADAVMDGTTQVRPATVGVTSLGLEIDARPNTGFVRYAPFKMEADENFLAQVIKPNATTLIEICLERIVDQNVFVLKGPIDEMPTQDTDFSGIVPSGNEV